MAPFTLFQYAVDISGTMGTMEEIMRKITSRIHMKSNARKLKQWKALEVSWWKDVVIVGVVFILSIYAKMSYCPLWCVSLGVSDQ